MKLSKEEARDVIWEDNPDWISVSGREVVSSSRWSIMYEQVFRYIPTGEHYLFEWAQGATEMQDELPFEYAKWVEPTKVELREVVREEWVKVNS